MRKVNIWLPKFNFADKYVYFEDLLHENPAATPNFNQRKNVLGTTAQSELQSNAEEILGSQENMKDNSNVMSAIKFLGQVAESERTKELMAINDYKKQLENLPPRFSQNPEFKKVKDLLNDLSSSLDSGIGDNSDNFYIALTTAINNIRQNSDEYIGRLKQLIEHNEIRQKGFDEVAKDQYLYRLYGDIEALFNDIMGTQEKVHVDSATEAIKDCVIKFIDQKHINITNLNGGDYLAIVAAIATDFEHFIQLEFYNDPNATEINANMVNAIYNKYVAADKQNQTFLQQQLDAGSEELQQILNDFKVGLGISEGTFKKHGKSFLAIQAKQARSRTRNNRNKVHQKLKNIISKNGLSMADEVNRFTFNVRTDQSHGNLFEAAAGVVGKHLTGGKIRGSAAADRLAVGQILVDYDISNLRHIIRTHTKAMREEISDYYINLSRENRFDSQAENFTNMNNQLADEINNLEIDLQHLDNIPDNIFIYHETLKLYETVESGQRNAFHGRSLNILNTIDEIFSLSGTIDLMLPNKEILEGICLNLSDLALGAELKGTLEQYFSIFAGLLMFDDIRNMAYTATNQLKENRVHQIHLYNVNGIFVPSSYILTKVYEALNESITVLETGRAAKAKITVSGANSTISEYVEANPRPHYHARASWNEYAEKVSKGITVDITFLISFIDFIKDLAN